MARSSPSRSVSNCGVGLSVFFLRATAMKYITNLPVDAYSDAIITDMVVPPKNFTLYKSLRPHR
jgi:hypothetical protein